MSITEEAHNLVNGDRRTDYGDMAESFNRIAGLWSAYIKDCKRINGDVY